MRRDEVEGKFELVNKEVVDVQNCAVQLAKPGQKEAQ